MYMKQRLTYHALKIFESFNVTNVHWLNISKLSHIFDLESYFTDLGPKLSRY